MTFRHVLTDALLHFLWQGTLIGCVAAVALHALRSHSPSARYATGLIALGLCMATPALTIWLLCTRGGLWTTGDSAAAMYRLIDTTIGWPNARPGWLDGIRALVVPAWIAGALALSGRLIRAGGHVRTLRLSALEPPASIVTLFRNASERLGIPSTSRVVLSHDVSVPSAIGWLRPLILLPVTVATGLTPAQLETIVAHELAHVRRHDYLVNLAQSIVETLLFYHPAIWWLSARVRHERELCCDDVVLRHYGSPVSYARALVSIDRLRVAAPSLALGALDGSLGFRVRRMLGLAPATPRSVAAPALTLLCVVAACVGSIVDPQRDEPRQETASYVIVNSGETIAVAFMSTLDASRREQAAQPVNLVGRRVSAIQIDGLSDAARATLTLPVRIGDLVTSETQRQVEHSAHAVNASLWSDVVALPNGQAAVLIAKDAPRSERERK